MVKRTIPSVLRAGFVLALSLLLLAGMTACSGGSSSSLSSSQSLSASQTSSSSSSSASASGSSSPSPSSSASSSSSDGELSVQEVASLLEDMIPRGREITGWFSGVGLDADQEAEPLDTANGRKFVPVKADGIQSVEDLKRATEEIFTRERAQNDFYQYALEGEYARYKEIDGVLCIDLNQGGANAGYNWQIDTLQIVSQTADAIVVEMDYQSSYGETGADRLTLKKTEDGWRIDSSL